MLVCHCASITDREIRDQVRQGAGSTEDVAMACGAGLCCGGCRPLVKDIVEEEQVRMAAAKRVALPMMQPAASTSARGAGKDLETAA